MKWKRLFSLLLAAAMCIALLPTGLHAATIVDSGSCGADGDDVTYTLDSTGLLTISGEGTIVDAAFSQRNDITAVVIEDGITAIGNSAFYQCSVLRSANVADSVTEIGRYAFGLCGNLFEIQLPDGLTHIGVSAFQECSSLTTVKIPESVTHIDPYAFMHCSSLTNIAIPESVIYLGGSAFSCCYALESVSIPYGGITEIDSDTFGGCSSLTDIEIPIGVTSIHYRAFAGCSTLAELAIPGSVTYIGDSAFMDCSSLTSITIPACVTHIGVGAFSGTTVLQKIEIAAGNKSFSTDVSGVLFDNQGNLIAAPGGISGTYSIPVETVCIQEFAFRGCCELTDVTIPDTVTSIGSEAFEGCTALSSITIPNSVTNIGSGVFMGCSAMTDVAIQCNIDSIPCASFNGCVALSNIAIPGSVTSIEDSAFYGCSSLKSITIPSSVTTIARTAFCGCKRIERITIPSEVNSIGTSAFAGCDSMDYIFFVGSAPLFSQTCFGGMHYILAEYNDLTATAYYPEDDTTWTEEVRQNYGGSITWVPYNSTHTHDWADATCTEPKTCNICGATEGAALGHKYHVTGETETQIVYTCIRCPASYTESKSTTGAAISVTDARGRVNDPITLEVQLENNPGFMWLQFNVAFDTSKLELVSYADSKLFPGYMAQQLSDGSFNFIWEDSANAANLTGDGVLATLSFKILEGAEAGDELPITITYDPENIYDAAFENVTFAPRNGTVSVISFIYGDVNDDTTINGKDVGMLKQYVAGHSVSINTDAADVYYDHKINAKDSGLLKQAVAGKAVVLGPSLNGANAQKLVLQPQSATNAVGSEPTIVINSGSASVGDTADVTLELKNNSGFLWLQFNVAFDTSKLELTGSADSRLFPGYMAQQLPDGSYNFIWEDSANAANLTGDGVLATLTFKVLDGAAVGEVIPFTISYDPENIYDETFSNVTFAVENGGITVLPTICNHTSLTAVTAKAPNCTEAGNIAYWICDGCDTIFADADASQEITLADTVIVALGHDWQDATCTESKTCKTCGATEGDALGHDWQDATCTEPKTCKTCGATEGDALGHDWADATCTEPKTCKTCGATEGDALGHDWADATCTEPKTCKTCGATEGEALGHDWQDATCTEPKTCKACGATEGDALGHDWQDATCTEPKTCKTCGATEGDALGHDWADATCTEPKTCKTCGATVGDALGHDWQDATCTEPKTCKTCGATEGDALGHDFSNNREYCRHGCGTKNPNYIPPQEPVTPVDPKPAKPTPAPVGPKPVTPAEPEQPVLPENPFTDVPEGSFYHDAILWAVEKGIIVDVESGVFNPEQSCTRGDMVTFMWRAAGSPEPLGKENPFTDVAEGDYYYKAVLWAVENGITKGTSASTFSPFTTCTRSQTVTFLHRFAGCPEVSGTNPFVDVAEGSYYYHAVLWAVENGITKGTGAAAFSPEMLCSRGQIITFLYRCMEL